MSNYQHYRVIELSNGELAEAVEMGTARDLLNKKNNIGHNKSFHQRAKHMGDDRGEYFHQKGCIGEAAVYKYLLNISQHFHLPHPDRTGWGAWTPKQRAKNTLKPDLTWLGRGIEVKTAETYIRFGVTRKLVEHERAMVVAVPELARPADFDAAGGVWTNKVTIAGAIELVNLKPTGAWEQLEVPFYDDTNGKLCRTVPFSSLTPVGVWARGAVASFQNAHENYA